jgi:transcriptional regulator with PAS, ATPase and Fis domain
MFAVRWEGAAPPAPLRAALRRGGVEVGGSEPVARIVWSARGRSLPAAKDGELPWLWLCNERVPSDQARAAVLLGAYDVIATADPGFAARVAARLAELAVAEPPPAAAPGWIAVSEASRGVLRQLARAARTSMPVLLTGETGTGKDVCARLVHEWSERKHARFVAINCAAIPNELIEAELFGYVRGAFSGATRDYDGQIQAAAGGSVFLDEIDDTPATLQNKLLRVLEDRVVSRLGENEWREVDFRIIAATNRDLERLIAQGAFGADLYERLAIVSIALVPLRERLEDLPALALHMVERFYDEEPAAKARGPVQSVSAAALDAFRAYPWPGNVRELRNVVFEALVHKKSGDELLLADLPRRILRREANGASLVDRAALRRRIEEERMNLRDEIRSFERAALLAALEQSDWNATRAARLLGEVGRGAAADPGGTVRAMMRRLRVRRPR